MHEDAAMFSLISKALEADDIQQGVAPVMNATEEVSSTLEFTGTTYEEKMVSAVSSLFEDENASKDPEEKPVQVKATGTEKVSIGLKNLYYTTVEDDYEQGEVGPETIVMSESLSSYIALPANEITDRILEVVKERTGLFALDKKYMTYRPDNQEVHIQDSVDTKGELIEDDPEYLKRWRAGEVQLFTADIFVSLELLHGNGLTLETILELPTE